MTSKSNTPRTAWKWVLLVLKWLLMILPVILLLAFAIESFLKFQDERRYQPPGQLFQVGEHKMHLWCEGRGLPVIVLDAGAGMFSSGWRWLMPELSPTTKTCAFDRSGLGWSETAPPPYDGVSASRELKELLEQAGIETPFVYVGHSLGANLGEIYNQQFPGDLAALILLEPANPRIFLDEVAEDRGTEVIRGTPISDCGMRCTMVTVMSSLGVVDLAFAMIDAINDPLYHPLALAEFKARTNRTENLHFLAQRGKYITEIMFQAADSLDFGDLPVAIFYSENAGELLGDHNSPEEMIEDQVKNRLAYQQAVDTSSQSRGLRQIDNANHLTMVMYQKPARQVAHYVVEILASLPEEASQTEKELKDE